MAKAANVPVYMDAGGMEGPLDPEILPCLTVLSPNETELSRLTSMPTENEAQVCAVSASNRLRLYWLLAFSFLFVRIETLPFMA